MAQLLNTTITGTLGATGAVAFGATLAVTGAVTFGSTLGVTGAIMGGSLAVAGALTGASLTVTGAAAAASLAVTGAATAATVVASGAVTGASFNGVTLTAGTNTFTITVGTASIVVAAGMGGTLGSNAFTSTAYVPQTRTVAGHTLSGNITIAASDLSNGTTGSGQIVLKSYVDGLVTSPINLKGGIDATANPNYPAATIGDSYRVTVAGRIGGASGKVVSVGDMVVCFTTSITGSEAAVGANWNVSEANIPGITGTGSALITAADAAAARAAISAETAGAAAAVEETLKTYAWKARVRIVVTTNVSLNGDLNAGNVWDSVSLAQGDRLLLVGQNTATENGIYIAPLSGTASRAADFDAWSAILGAIVPVEQGSVYAGTAWRCTNGTGGTIGSSSVVFAQMREGDSRSYVPVADGGSLYPLAGSHWEAVSATASFYVYLPFSPSLGTEVFFRDAGADFSTHSVTFAGQSGWYLNGNYYGSVTFYTKGATYRAVYEYDGSINTNGWKVHEAVDGRDFAAGDVVIINTPISDHYAEANTKVVFRYGQPGPVNAWLPSSPTEGDELWLIDGGQNFHSQNLLVKFSGSINGVPNAYPTMVTVNTAYASVHCVWAGETTGWQVSVLNPAGSGNGQYVDVVASGGSLYPSVRDRWSMIGSYYSYIYLPSSAGDGDEIYIRDGGVNFNSYGLGLYLNGGGYLNGAWYGSQWFYERGATYRAVYGNWKFAQNTNWGWKVDRVMTERDPFHEVVSITDNTSSFSPSVNTTTMLTYSVPGGDVSAYLPSNYTLGDEVIIIDGGRNFSAYALVLSSNNGINGVSGSPATLDITTRNALVRCVWTGGGTGWQVSVEAARAGGDWTPTPAASIYPNAGDRLEITNSGSYPYIYLPSGGSLRDVIYVRDGGIDFSAGYNLNIYINGGGNYLNGSWGSSFYTYKKGATIRCEYGYWSFNGSSNYGWKVEEVYSEQLTLDNSPEVITNDSTQYLYPYAHETKILRSNGSPQYNVTAYLPSPAVEGNEVRILDGGWNFSSHSLTVQAMSGNVNGSGSSATISTRHADVRSVFVGGNTGWLVTFSSP